MERGSIARTMSLAAVLVIGVAACQSTGTPSGPSAPHSAGEALQLQSVYFETDSAELDRSARSVLKANAKLINANPGWGKIAIQGHCDERGESAYNLELGERRARVVKEFLVDRGVSTKRLRTVSLGEEHPAVRGHEEAAWRYNRRSELQKGS